MTPRPLAALALLLALAPAAASLAPGAPDPEPAAWPGLPARSPVSPLVNGGFEACAEREQALLAYGPRALSGRMACPPWLTRPGLPGALGALPWSRSSGDVLGSDGRYGVLRVSYDPRDGVLLVEQTIAADAASLVASPERVRVTLRASEAAVVGVRLERDGVAGDDALVPALGSPVTLTAGAPWATFDLAFPEGVGTVRAVALEIHPGTPPGAVVEVEAVVLVGARVGPAFS